VAAAESGIRGEVRDYGRIANTAVALDRLVRKLGGKGVKLRFCYEAGPCGYGIQRILLGSCGPVPRVHRCPSNGDQPPVKGLHAIMSAKTLAQARYASRTLPTAWRTIIPKPSAVCAIISTNSSAAGATNPWPSGRAQIVRTTVGSFQSPFPGNLWTFSELLNRRQAKRCPKRAVHSGGAMLSTPLSARQRASYLARLPERGRRLGSRSSGARAPNGGPVHRHPHPENVVNLRP
jgi:hypothetical protein